MNPTVNFGGAGLSFGVLAAGLIFAFGLWRGREDLAKQAARDVLLATILTSLVGMLPYFWLASNLNFVPGLRFAPLLNIVWTAVVILLNFVPLAVAARWMDHLRRVGAGEAEAWQQPAPSLGSLGQGLVVVAALLLSFTLLQLTR